MATPLVSIIIPVYNAEFFLSAAINSVLEQSWLNKEIIVIDDGSTDNSLQILSTFSRPEIRVFTQKNQGAGAARNRGLREAKGDYVQFLDADDLLSPDKIELQVNALREHPNCLAVCSTIHFNGEVPQDEQPSLYEETFLFNDNDPAHFLTNLWGGFSEHGSMIALHAWLTPRSIINKTDSWNEALTLDDDGEYFSRIVLNSNGIIKTDGISYYRKHASHMSVSAGNNKQAFQSALLSALLKKEHLLKYTNTYEAKLAIYKQLINVAVAVYPTNPEIYQRALRELPKINTAYHPPLGGRLTMLLESIFGWRFVKYLKFVFIRKKK